MPEPTAYRHTTEMGAKLEVKLKLIFGGQMNVQYIYAPMTLEEFYGELKVTCGLDQNSLFTVKWLDEDGDPCTIESQRELDEAFRLYEVNRDNELNVHVFPNVPLQPGLPCQGEDKTVYRRGARRWKKYYRVNGHLFQAKRFNRAAVCSFCQDKIWGLGLQGYRCVTCRLLIHKKCHKLIKVPCSGTPQADTYPSIRSQGSSPSDSSSLAATNKPLYPPGTSNRNRLANGDNSQTTTVHLSTDSEGRFEGNVDGMDYSHTLPEGTETLSRRTEPPRFAVSLDDFDLLRVIGRGSYAKVLQVELKKNRKVYAMKIIKKSLVNDDEDIDWVQTEKHVFEVATNHPFLVGLHSCFQTSSRLFFVIEFVPGGDMMFHMQRQRRLPEEHARFYSSEIIVALHFLHTKGIIYRDLKLDNVLIDADGHIKLTDYGMCKEGIKVGDTTSTFCGTPNYIAPEILRGEEYSFSVDWWALGVLMYEMMAGRSPFDIVGSADNPDASSEDYLFQVILEKAIRIPRSLSVKAASVLKGFLNKNAAERLGCNSATGFQDIQNHPFFKSVDWDLLEQKQVIPPYKPPVTDVKDLENFDRVFTEEPVVLTPDNSTEISKIDQSEFDGFEYINPLLMSTEDSV